MFSTFRTSWEMVTQSLAVLKRQKTLVLFPILSGLACLLVVVSFLAPILLIPDLLQFFMNAANRQQGGDGRILGLLVAFVFYFVNFLIIVFFNAALASCAVVHFKGGEPTLGDGLSAAGRRLPQIIGWALLAATIGMILRAIEERAEWIGRLVAGLLGVFWTLATYLVVPILAVEGVGPIAAVKRSTALLRQVWGEGLAGGISLGLLGFLFMLPAFVLFVLGISLFANPALGGTIVALGVIYLMVVSIILSTLKQIYIAGLYLYAAEGQLPGGFSQEIIESAFRKKKNKRGEMGG
jgi:hypothetical protein